MVSALKRRFAEKKQKFAYLHQNMPGACGGVAFYMTRAPAVGELVDPGNCRLLDGSIPNEHDPALCGSCGQPLFIGQVAPVENIQAVQ